MFSLKIKNAAGLVVELTHDRKNYAVVDVQGLTRPTAQINTTVSGSLDGSFYNSARVEMRNIVLAVVLYGDIEANRQRLYDIFPLPKMACTVYFENANRRVQIEGYVETLEGNLFENRETMQISILCPRPYWEDMESIVSELSSVLRLFEFPFDISEPIPVSEVLEVPMATVHNGGDAVCGLRLHIDIDGDVEGLTIYNSTMQIFLGFTFTFEAGDVIDVCTISGSLSTTLTRSGTTSSLLPYLKAGSTWIKLALGDNQLTYTLTDGDAEDVKITVTSANLYGGV